jgi:hypothetical protein
VAGLARRAAGQSRSSPWLPTRAPAVALRGGERRGAAWPGGSDRFIGAREQDTAEGQRGQGTAEPGSGRTTAGRGVRRRGALERGQRASSARVHLGSEQLPWEGAERRTEARRRTGGRGAARSGAAAGRRRARGATSRESA